MMELESDKEKDFIFSKLLHSLQKSNNTLHKKSIILVKSIHSSFSKEQLEGIDGVKLYTKSIVDLCINLINKNDFSEDDLLNYESLIFVLAICIKHLNNDSLKTKSFLNRIEMIIKFSLNFRKNYHIMKYSNIIIEKIILSRSKEELNNPNDEIVKFYKECLFIILSSTNKNKDLQNDLIKSICKVIQRKKDDIKYSILKDIIDYFKNKINQMIDFKDSYTNEYDDEENEKEDNKILEIPISNNLINTISIPESENILKFFSAITQFLPFDLLNDSMFSLYNLIEKCQVKSILTNAFLCIDIVFATQKFNQETNEQMILLLLNKDILSLIKSDYSNFENNQKENSKLNKLLKINDNLIVAYMKCLTSVLLSYNLLNQNKALQFFIAILTIFSELLTDINDFVKGTSFNLLQNLFDKILNRQNVNNLFNDNNKKNLEFDINTMTLDNKKENINGDFLLEKIAKILLYLISERFEDKRMGYNLLLTFIEKINTCDRKIKFTHINKINEQILLTLSEKDNKDELLKIFIGKSFNYIPLLSILKYYPLDPLNFDMENNEYTNESNIWLISYMNKFLKDNVQTISDFYHCFKNIIFEIFQMIIKLKNSPYGQKKNNNDNNTNNNNNEMIEDEIFEVNESESKHLRELKIKRLQLILTQIYSLLGKFYKYSNEYAKISEEILQNFEQYINDPSSCPFNNSKEICFKFLSKAIDECKNKNDSEALNVIKNKGGFFFQKILNLLLNGKLSKSESQLGFNVISKYCTIIENESLFKIIIQMIQKFDETVNTNILTEKVNNEKKSNMEIDTGNKKKESEKKREKEINKLAMRLEITNYLLKYLNIVIQDSSKNNNNNSQIEMINILFKFFEQYFFKFSQSHNSNEQFISKKIFELFLTILSKINDIDFAYQIFNNFSNKKGLELISTKQKGKLFEYIIEKIILKFEPLSNIKFEDVIFNEELLLNIISLTKNMNKKIRNISYDIIGKLTELFTKKKLFENWVKVILSTLNSNDNAIKSSSINALSRIFWEDRNELNIIGNIISISNYLFPLFKSDNKEIIKSLFLFIRVLLFILKNSEDKNKINNDNIIKTIITSICSEMKEQNQKEFKVKIRNLFKNLIINYSYEKIKEFTPENFLGFIQYVNKHSVKKINEINKEEEELHGYNKNELDDSVMLDNENNLIDEEEDYIKKEFKKMNKIEKDKEARIIDKIENWDIADDDIEEVRKKELETSNKKNKKEETLDKIEQIFVKDNIQLNNFFYINPFVTNNDNKNNENDKNEKNKTKDVIYDINKGKIIVKDLEKEIEMSKLKKKKKRDLGQEINLQEEKKAQYLKKKRVQNVQKDNDLDEIKDEDDDNENKKNKKIKVNESESIKVNKYKKKKEQTHYVKYSGEEYKNKKGKGDKLIKGQYEPFAYIQLNPKSLNTKGERENIKIFNKLMKNDNKK